MIYIVETPHQGAPIAWVCKRKDNFVQSVLLRNKRSSYQTYEEATGFQILENHGCFSVPELRMDYPELEKLARLLEQHGLDAMYYRGFTQSEYTATPIDAFADCVELVGYDLHSLHIYMTDKEAIEALADDAEWRGHQGFNARESLKALL